MEKVLTVTIPSYNAETFLRKGMRTLLDERILEDIEILIVDDGSTDNTANIADEYQSNYPNTVKAVHKANGGHGSAINSGIQAATGKYFCVIDADDWVDTDNFVKIVKYLKKCQSDSVVADMVYVNSEDKVLRCGKINRLPKHEETLLDNYIEGVNSIGMSNYFIISNILKEHNIQCHEHLSYVDNEYMLYSLMHVKTVTYIDIIVYHYWIGREGQSISIDSKRRNLNQQIIVTDFLIQFFKQNYHEMTIGYRKYYARQTAWFLRGIYSTLLSYNNTEKRKEMELYDSRLQKQSMQIYHANRNLCIFLLRISHFKSYRLMALIYKVVVM